LIANVPVSGDRTYRTYALIWDTTLPARDPEAGKMKQCGNWPIAVCTWSLALTDVADIANALERLGINHVHLSLFPAFQRSSGNYLREVKEQEWTITSTMMSFPEEDYSTPESIKKTGGIAPDLSWHRNYRKLCDALSITADLGVRYLSLHIGFIGKPDSITWEKMSDRTLKLADKAGCHQVQLLLETGQESAEELKRFLEGLNHQAIGVNFDPANMILYNKGDPVPAMQILKRWIKHVHIKDAIHTEKAGTWGQEVVWGKGQVGVKRFLQALEEIRYYGALAIERETGNQRFADIQSAIQILSEFKI
jgi:L-ribulose-5-phosphate 3-epimerase